MNNTSFIIYGALNISWAYVVVFLAIAAFFLLAYSIYTVREGRRRTLWIYLPIALLLSWLFARLIYWYSHKEQFGSLGAALTDFSPEGYAMTGILLGLVVAAWIIKKIGLIKKMSTFLDAICPGISLGMGLLYLTYLFNYRCRGKIEITEPRFCHLPFASRIPSNTGGTQYRVATFFLCAIAFLVISKFMASYYFTHRKIKGRTFSLFLFFYSAVLFLLDSTRYDADYFPFNGFVSIQQIVSGVTFLGFGIYHAVCCVRRKRFKWYHVILWVALLSCMTAAGLLEYMIQRWAENAPTYYIFMALSCIGMVIISYRMMLSAGNKKKNPDGEDPEDTDGEAGDGELGDGEAGKDTDNAGGDSETATYEGEAAKNKRKKKKKKKKKRRKRNSIDGEEQLSNPKDKPAGKKQEAKSHLKTWILRIGAAVAALIAIIGVVFFHKNKGD